MQHLSEKTQFSGFLFPQLVQSTSSVWWENKVHFDCSLSRQHVYQKLSQSSCVCKNYSKLYRWDVF